MKIINTILALGVLLTCFSCQDQPKDNLSENSIYQSLKSIKGKGILFGHQDDLAYGIGWKYVKGESDVKRVSGDYPALFGWELGGIELGRSMNLDSVPFQKMNELATWAHEQGGVNTFSWHPFSVIDGSSSWNGKLVVVPEIIPGGKHHDAFKKHLDAVADFFLNLKDEEGNQIPFIFRPWHEMDGTWFWWGVDACNANDFQKLFRFTIEYLRDERGIKQMISAYSPDCRFSTAQEYLTWYPGDDVVDILGMDDYHDFKTEGGEHAVVQKLGVVIELAKQKNKLSALTETGCGEVKNPQWFTDKLGFVLNNPNVKENISYAMVWRNAYNTHFYFPYPGHPAADNAKAFTNQDHILLLKDFNRLKNNHEQ